jgi:hypothetical protein
MQAIITTKVGATRDPTIVAKGGIAAVAVMSALPRARFDQSKERSADLQCNVKTATQSLTLRKQKKSCRRKHISRSITILCDPQSTGFAGLWSVGAKLFLLGQKLGYNITYNSYYSPIPDLRELNDDLWLKRS